MESSGKNESIYVQDGPMLRQSSLDLIQEAEQTDCCSCRQKVVHSHFKTKSLQNSKGRSTFYQETFDGGTMDVEQFDSMHFFDAVENPEDIEYDEDFYPIITSFKVPKKKCVTLVEPATMLGHDDQGEVLQPAASQRDLFVSVRNGNLRSSTKSRSAAQNSSSGAMASSSRRPGLGRRLSSRFFGSQQKSTAALQQALLQPRIPIQERGFPGALSPDELEEIQKLAAALKTGNKDLREQVHILRQVEEEPYALCRFLRATKFNTEALLERLEKGKEAFIKAKVNDFYPDIEATIQAPLHLFLKQYPFVSAGRAKNGCPVNYFRAGKINAEGIYCLTTFAGFEAFMWHQSFHQFQNNIRASQKENPNIVRMESITVLDLEGLTYSTASSTEAIEAVKLASKIGDYFPETMHCIIILNAPSFFTLLWSIIKQIVDPRTAKRIQIFGSTKKGLFRLKELIDESEIPSDYGGSRMSIEKTMADSGGKHNRKRSEVELLILRKKGKKKHMFHLLPGEVLHVHVYTRSASSAQFSVANKEQSKKSLFDATIRGKAPKDKKDEYVPTCTEVAKGIVGPGKCVVEASDLNDATSSSAPHGHFLVVGEIF